MRFATRCIGAATLLLAACNGGGPGAPVGLPAANPAAGPLQLRSELGISTGKIKHIVIVVQENRSFNDLFHGFPGAKYADYGYDSYGKRIKLVPIGLETYWDIDHSSYAFFAACNGTGKIPGRTAG